MSADTIITVTEWDFANDCLRTREIPARDFYNLKPLPYITKDGGRIDPSRIWDTGVTIVHSTEAIDWNIYVPVVEAPPAKHKQKTNSLDHEPNVFDYKPKQGESHKHWSEK